MHVFLAVAWECRQQGITGNAATIMTGFDHALSNSTINGVGITMEGIWTNYPIFEMTLQSAYAAQVSGATLGEWWESYGTRRYGQQSQIITSHPFFKMAQHLDLRCVLLSIRPRQVPYPTMDVGS